MSLRVVTKIEAQGSMFVCVRMCVCAHHVRWTLRCCSLPAQQTLCCSRLMPSAAGQQPRDLCPPHCLTRLPLNREHGNSSLHIHTHTTEVFRLQTRRTAADAWKWKEDFKYLRRSRFGNWSSTHSNLRCPSCSCSSSSFLSPSFSAHRVIPLPSLNPSSPPSLSSFLIFSF